MKFILVITGILFAGGSGSQPPVDLEIRNTGLQEELHSSSDSSAPESIATPSASGLSASARPRGQSRWILSPDQSGDFATVPMLPGVAQPARRVDLSPAVDGILAKVSIREGQRVKAGQELGQIDDSLIRAALVSARATAKRRGAIEEAQSEVDNASLQAKRLKRMDKMGAVSEADFDEARARLTKAKASLLSAQEDAVRAQHLVELELVRLAQLRIVAPFDGVISRFANEPGAYLDSQTVYCSLISLKELHLDLHLPVEFYGTLKVGDKRILLADAPMFEELTGVLISIDPVIDPATRTFRCRFLVPNPELRLPAGFTAILKI